MPQPSSPSSAARIEGFGAHEVAFCDSLEKVYGPDQPRPHALGHLLLPRRGVGSFQIVVKPPSNWMPGGPGDVIATVEAPTGLIVTPHAVDFVPCSFTASENRDEHYDHVGPAFLPDILRPLSESVGLQLVPAQWRALWFTVAAGTVPGDHTVHIRLTSQRTGELIGTAEVPVSVLDVELPESPIVCAQWFHVDALAQYYGTEPYSEYGWELIERFATAAVESGSTSLLTPIHTPPLDTAEGTRRLDVGLVGIRRNGSSYEFDMTRLLKWIAMCKRVGVRELEMAHLFTQWGGLHAPAIDDMEGRALFGWHSDSLGDDYQEFLATYIPAVRQVLDEHWGGPVFWHLTDEPSGEHAPRYRALKQSVETLLEGCLITDALSDPELWTSGLVDPPIVATDHAGGFLSRGLQEPWLYYCTAQSVDVANRFIGMPSYRNRVIGWQLFKHDAMGFLHWGFNFWNTQLSRRPLDPFLDPTAAGAFQAGDTSIVYPGPGGEPWTSIRFRVFREAMDDLRLFTALAKERGRGYVEDLLGLDSVSLTDYPRDPGHYLRRHAAALRELAGTGGPDER